MSLDERTITHLRTIVQNAHIRGEPPERKGQILQGQGTWYVIDGEAQVAFDACVTDILEDSQFENTLSRKYVEKALQNRITDLLDAEAGMTEERLRTATHSLTDELSRSIASWDVTVPVVHLQLEGIPSVAIADTELFPYEAKADEIHGDMWKVIETTRHTTNEKRNNYESLIEFQQQNFGGQVCARTTVVAEGNKAAELAIAKIESAVNLLRAYSPFLFPRSQWNLRKIDFREGTRDLVSHAFRFSPSKGFNTGGEAIGLPYTLSQEDLDHLRQRCAFNELDRALREPIDSLTGIERRLRIAVRWLGLGIHERKRADKIVRCMTAMESLFLKRRERNKGHKIANRAAFVLETDQGKKKSLYQELDRLYNLRSDIVHEGTEDVSPEDANSMVWIAANALVTLAQKRTQWADIDDLVSWVEGEERTHGMLK